MTQLSRRAFMGFLAAPAIVRVASIMPVRSPEDFTPFIITIEADRPETALRACVEQMRSIVRDRAAMIRCAPEVVMHRDFAADTLSFRGYARGSVSNRRGPVLLERREHIVTIMERK